MELGHLHAFFQELNRLVERAEQRDNLDKKQLNDILDKIGISLNTLSNLSCQDQILSFDSKTIINSLVENLLVILQEVQRESVGFISDRVAIIDYTPNKLYRNGPGRPKWDISEDVLLYFRDLGYCWKEISSMLCVSRWTVGRRIRELGISEITGYSSISDEALEQTVKDFKDSHGSFVGRSLVLGHLRSLGLRVQHKRVIETLRKIDPETSRIRWNSLIRRRKYSVPGPNSLWHIDGHHSLINWKFVIHGGMDGYSRVVVYLWCSTNNKKDTVLKLYDMAVNQWGIPSRVRSDKGGENALVWQRMVELRGDGRGSYLAGSSVHNQRIERLWRDVWTYVCAQFYYTFQAMETQGILNMDTDLHVFILHYVFLPRINRVITSFTAGWNNHPLRTERNWSPNRIWNNGMIDRRNRSQHQVAELFDTDGTLEDLEWYGMDWAGPTPNDDGLSTVEVDDVNFEIAENILQTLNSIDPLRDSTCYGIDIYLEALALFSVDTNPGTWQC